MTVKRRLNWRPDVPDYRDFEAAKPELRSIPPSVDLRSYCPPVYDQGALGSCTAFAVAGVMHTMEIKTGANEVYEPSQLFIYYNERESQGTVNEDSGSTIRTGFKSVARLGACSNAAWPYKVQQFAKKPPNAAYKLALKNTLDRYERVQQSSGGMMASLAQGYPHAFGFSVYTSFMNVKKNGVVPMPKKSDSLEGGHAVVCVGYTTDEKFIVRNSWGKGFGDQGYVYFPFAYLANTKLSSDHWRVDLL